jgi:hypothetical protein
MKLPKVETLIIMAFFGIVAIWAISKCSSKRNELGRRVSEEERDDRPSKRDSVGKVKQLPKVVQQQPVNPAPAATVQQPVVTQAAPLTATPTSGQKQQLPVLGKPSTVQAPAPQPAAAAPAVGKPQTQAQAPAAATQQQYSILYVTIDGLKVHKEPNLKGAVVTKLKLDQPVYFLNQKTEKVEEISLGYEKVKDHWVKVRTKAGKEGWVFGAGVHYYKMKRKGVLEK